MLDIVLERFDAPDETRVFDKGRFEIVRLGGMTLSDRTAPELARARRSRATDTFSSNLSRRAVFIPA